MGIFVAPLYSKMTDLNLNMANMANMDLTEIKNWDVRDLNKALMAAIMAQQLERGNKVAPIATLAPTTSTTTSTTTTTTTTTTELRTTLIATLPLMTERIEVSEMSGRLITQIVSGSVLIMLGILMIVAYVILINHNKIDYRKRMTFVLILICTRELTYAENTIMYFLAFIE